MNRGGKRPGAGRPCGPADSARKTRCVRTTDAQWAVFHALGGNAWLLSALDPTARTVHMTDAQWKAFQSFGGAAWLAEQIDALRGAT